MSHKIYLTDDYDGEQNYLTVISEKELEDTTNSYDMFIKSYSYELHEDNFVKKSNGIFAIYESDADSLPEWLHEMCTWDWRNLTEKQRHVLIEASKYEIDHSDEGDSTDVYEIKFDEENGFTIHESEPNVVGKHIEYWDGHNWKKEDIEHDFYDTRFTDVTDEYDDYDNWEEIYSSRSGSGTGHYNAYKVGKDDGTTIILIQEVSYYQGEQNNGYREATADNILDLLRDMTDAEDYLQDQINEYCEGIREYCKKGQEVEFEDGEFVFKYRAEEYHFDYDDLKDCSYEESYKTAADAIRQRRIEAIADKFAENNYSRIFELPLNKIFVERADSIEAGNCKPHTDDLIEGISATENIEGDFALRADHLLNYRDDNYSRRAVLRAYRNNHFIHAKN